MENKILPFHKFEATGNDFIFIDASAVHVLDQKKSRKQWVPEICGRHRGVGADGVVVLRQQSDHQFLWQFYNSDGGEAEMCGNAARCAMRMAQKISPHILRFELQTKIGVVEGRVDGEEIEISFKLPHMKLVAIDGGVGVFKAVHLIDTGVPHAVFLLEEDPWLLRSRATTLQPLMFEKKITDLVGERGANLTFVQKSTEPIRTITLERGVNDFTLACGTGVLATVAAISTNNEVLEVQAPGGKLRAQVNHQTGKVVLRGAARFVFGGNYEII